MKFSKTLLIALPVAFTSFSALADNPINDQIEAEISSQTLKTVAVAEHAAPVKTKITGDNPINAQIEAQISSQTLKKAPVASNSYDRVYAQLESKIAQLKQNSNSASFVADVQAAKELALQAKQDTSSLFHNMYDADDNYRQLSDIQFKNHKLNRLIDNLDSVLESAQKGHLETAKAVLSELSVRS
ncbi:hypothetical protein SAMN05660772_01408 [Pasteurella testudinis DSM 23072]|uniref:Uncharacterized protein n=1 Tax=Pasteurella testudinis DSM 23072 TaxID=1122938 RepID=A0A1W1V8N8_9PAST|nr:hypothetical protein [Pasteurella testudinis]SMB89799.1 hypothetical protein SAMN05660772_01408 [Pasteurella testudinis DSM 23072]SUB52090.1 Soluble cytochrome b562 [Pasteurella testudinis]